MASHSPIQEQLDQVARRQARVNLWLALAACWGVAALVACGILLLEKRSGWASSLALPVVGVLGLAAAVFVIIRRRSTPTDWRHTARRIETHYAELDGRLVTAVQQQPPPGGQLNYLQQRLVEETLDHSRRVNWIDVTPARSLTAAQIIHWTALACFVICLFALRVSGGRQLLSRIPDQGITITPGDVALERGSSLVVLARFQGALPPNVVLAFGQVPELQRFPLVKSLGDPMFGGSIPEVLSNFVYRVEYGGQFTREFKVTVYEHPRLERADADLTFPSYTGLPPKKIENTQRVSAVEGSQLDLSLQFNKPVASARMVARTKEHTEIALSLEPDRPAASLKQFTLESSKSYDLQLVDLEGRTNKVPAEFVFNVLKNRTPELRMTSPRGDLRPSPIEEVSFEGTVWDDFGVKAYGIAYTTNGQNPQFIELGPAVSGNEKKTFSHVLRLEELGVKPDELISWFAWADDLGPDGQVRRNMSDLFFGEVRPFEEVFREGQGMEGQPGAGSMGQDQTEKLTDLQKQIVNATWKLQRESTGSGNKSRGSSEGKKPPARSTGTSGDQSRTPPPGPKHSYVLATSFNRFAHIAGQLTPSNATEGDEGVAQSSGRKAAGSKAATKGAAPSLEEDVGVVLESQAQALEQAKRALEQQRNPQSATLWQKAVDDMEAALARLEKATNSPAVLKDALAAEQQAYQALIRLQAHEYQVSRSRNRNQSGSGRNQQMQRQLEEMDLTQSEDRYENQREAQRVQNPEQHEQLQVLSRLQELARRQQDLNERLKELQAALAEARTEKERAEIERQLKRLQQEERQVLTDVDELRQRMERPENQSRMAEERKRLEETRQDVQRASEAAGQGAASQALAAGTRAQQQLQQLRDDMRKKSSSQFSEDLRQLRSQARELARRQDDILKKIQDEAGTDKKTLSGGQGQNETRAALAKQKELMTNILEHATQVSQQAEEAEPLLSRQLYDSVRKFSQDTAKDLKEAETELLNHGPMTRSLFELLRNNSEQGASKLQELTSEMLRLGYQAQAGRIGERARPSIENLKKGIERAAESVIGDDTEALRMAERQLDDVSRQLQNEINRGQAADASTNSTAAGTRAGSQANKGRPSQTNTNSPSTDQASRGSSKAGAQDSGQGQQANQSSEGQGTSSSQSDQASQQGQQGKGQQGKGQQAQQGQGEQGQGEQAQGQQGQGQQGQGQQGQGQQGQGQQGQGQQGQGQGQQQGGEGTSNQTADASPTESPAQGDTPGGQNTGSQRARGNRGTRQAGANNGGGAAGGDPADTGAVGGARNWNWNQLLTQNAQRQIDPITGEDFTGWSDRLREVEELVDDSGMRDDVAKARDRARVFRQEFKRERKKPDWAVLDLQVMKPLTEVRQKLADELARRESRDALVPLDRDPVPNRYSDLVRRYYEELGKEK